MRSNSPTASDRDAVRTTANVAAGFLEIGAAEHLTNKLPDEGHSGLPSHQDYLIEIVGFQLRVG